ncbi:SidC [Legionella sp.]|uniref:SidC n=1 Tax=Legionella sp. TaxID=459 RepID=UPI0032200B97
MLELPLREPRNPRYLHIGPDNTIHVFMPIVGGTIIGTDNTCKAVYSLQEFFGKGSNSNLKTTLKGELLAYQEALEYDLSLLEALTPLAQQKQERLMQIKAYLDVLKHLEQHEELNCLNSGFPSYPRPLESMMQSREHANVYSMVLRPTEEDGYLRLESANPVFSVAHKSVARNIMTTVSPLQEALIQAYSPLNLEAKGLKFQTMRETMKQSGISRAPVDFEHLRDVFQKRLRALMNDESIDLTHTPDGKLVNQAFLDEAMVFSAQTTSPKEYMNALLEFCVPQLFDTTLESPFDTLENAERWSVATQFLLGLINIHGVTQGHLNRETNWGRILDEHPDLSQSLAQTLAKAQQANDSIESVCLDWINAHAAKLKLHASFSPKDLEQIKEDFATLYTQIEDSPHFDEFLVFRRDRKGDFVTHQASICTSFATFACHPLLGLPKEVTQPLERAQVALATLGTQIPHNPMPEEKITLDVTHMSLSEVQTLYERIATYKDPEVKARLQAQLKQERPDFKPKIDAKQFLQCVAFGQQNEAEALLKEDIDRAQELLLTDNMSFTDYSGRTFTCTAYEYAYWAKDTHMCRMLEKYMNNTTKHDLLQRVQRIEELVGEGLFKTPRGLTYTQNGKEHRSAHFDLAPLKQALKTYIDAHTQSPKQSAADWEALDILWVKVGLPQRDVPAHIAQEYCHPKRSFKEVSENPSLLDATDPNNLVRQLKFYNLDTGAYDSWFTPDSYSSNSGLGFSFAIFRVLGRPIGRGGTGVSAFVRGIDLAAIEAIDKARTDDLKQSLANLTAPSSLLGAPFSAS